MINFSKLYSDLYRARTQFACLDLQKSHLMKLSESRRLSNGWYNIEYLLKIEKIEYQKKEILNNFKLSLWRNWTSYCLTKSKKVSLPSGLQFIGIATTLFYYEKQAIDFITGNCREIPDVISEFDTDNNIGKPQITYLKLNNKHKRLHGWFENSSLQLGKIASGLIIIILTNGPFFGLTSCKRKPENYTHTIISEQSFPNGSKITAWNNGRKLGEATVSNFRYEISFTTDNPREILDSVAGRMEGFNPTIFRSVDVGDVRNIDINLALKIFWLYGTASTPGATAKAYDGGMKLEELVVGTNGAYQTKNITLPADLKVDSIVVTAPSRDKKKLVNQAVAENANKLEFVLDLTAYDHWFSNNASTPGAHAEWFKNGIIVMNADVAANGSYLTGKWVTNNGAETVDSVVTKKNGHNKLKLVNVSAVTGNNDLRLLLDQIIYQYSFVGSNTSPNGTAVAVYEGGANIANGTVSGSSYATNNWTSTLASMNIDSVVFAYPGHATQRFIDVAVVPGTNTKNATLVQNTYNHTLIINLASSEAAEGHKVRDGTVTIDGVTYAVTNQSLTRSWTDTNPAASVTYDINVNGVGHQDVGPKTVSVGTTLTENRTLTANDFTGDVAYNVKDGVGQNVAGALVSASQSKSGTTGTNGNVTLLGFVLDENLYSEPVSTNINHAITKTGYTPKNGSASINAGANSVNEVIQQIINSYNLDLVMTDVTGDNLLVGKTVNVREPDGDIQSVAVAGKHTPIAIQGTYDATGKVKIWLTPTAEYDGFTGTVNQSLKLPLASVYDKNETRADTLALVIGDVASKTAYVSFMDKVTRDDYDVMSIAEEGGNSEYNYLDGNGERVQNIILAKTTKQGTATPNDIKKFYGEAVAMHIAKYTTAQGLQLVKTTYDSIPGYPSTLPQGTFYLLVDNTENTPGNAKIGSLPETYNRGYTLLRTFDNQDRNLAVLELGESIIPLKDSDITGGNSHYYLRGSDNVIYDVKVKPLRVALMYDGLKIPDPTTKK